MKRKILCTAVIGISAVCLMEIFRCSTPVAGNGSQTPNSKITAMLYNPDGSPARGVHVYIRPDSALADTSLGVGRTGDADSTVTDNNGRYAFDTTLKTGTYVIEAASGNNAVLIDSVVVTSSHAPDTLPPDTLRPAGAIKGVVYLSEGGDPRKVFVLAFGINRFASVNADGSFKFSGLARGDYDLRLISSLDDYDVLDTVGVPVLVGDTTDLGTLALPFTGVPTPKNLVVSYDTLNETVMLSWDMADTSLISGYNVYRSIKGKNFSRVTQTPLPKTQTVYYDTDTGLTVGTVYEYRVVSRTQAGVESRMIDIAADTALIVSASMVTTTFSWSSVNTIHDTASINDTVKVIVSYSNPTRKIDSIEWYLDTAQVPLRTKIDSSLSGKDSIVYYCPAQAGLRQMIVKAVDEANTTWRDTFDLWVIQDAPMANAGDDACVTMNDTVHLHGSATQMFGSIVKWEWKFGTGNWTTTAGPDTMIIAPSTEQTVVCSLAVTDDDGNRAVDGINIVAFIEVKCVAAGCYHSLILKSDNTLWACGYNGHGQLGDGTTTDRWTPVQVMSNVQSVEAGYGHSLILKSDNTLWACGWNYYGQLGDGTTTERHTPVLVMSSVQSVAAGYYHSLILKSDNTLWACGYNSTGQLGDGTDTNRLTPVLVTSSVKSVTAGYFHSLILKSDNTLWACGDNGHDQLGDGTDTNRFTPVLVTSSVQGVAAGYFHSLILKSDNTLWACGWNYYGQLGDGTTTDRWTPVQVMSNVQSVEAGYGHSLILKSDNTLWACGWNSNGQLGDGTTTDHWTPVQVMSSVQSVKAGDYHSLILKSDNTLWACGSNGSGQLGDGTTTDRWTPVRVIPPQQ